MTIFKKFMKMEQEVKESSDQQKSIEISKEQCQTPVLGNPELANAQPEAPDQVAQPSKTPELPSDNESVSSESSESEDLSQKLNSDQPSPLPAPMMQMQKIDEIREEEDED